MRGLFFACLNAAEACSEGRRWCLQVLLFSDRDHVRALSASDAWAVVGNSSSLIPLAARYSSIDIAAPASGVPLWADLWAVPAGVVIASTLRKQLLRGASLEHCRCQHTFQRCDAVAPSELVWGWLLHPE